MQKRKGRITWLDSLRLAKRLAQKLRWRVSRTGDEVVRRLGVHRPIYSDLGMLSIRMAPRNCRRGSLPWKLPLESLTVPRCCCDAEYESVNRWVG